MAGPIKVSVPPGVAGGQVFHAPAARVQRFVVRLRLRFRVLLSVGEPFDNFKASVQHFLTVFKIYSDEFLIVTAKGFTSAVKTFRTGWYFESRGSVLFENWEVQFFKWFEPIQNLAHLCAAERQTDLIRNDCAGIRDEFL